MTLGIELDRLTMRFNGVAALDDLSLRLEGGKIYGLVGRNGAGKSTLMAILASFRPQTSGSVRIDGEAPFENAGIMRQVCLIRDKLDVDTDDNLTAAFEFAESLRPNWDQEYAEALAKKFNLPMDKKIGGFSRGMQSAVGAILGLATRAPLTMFDETYLGMDAPSRYLFYDELLNDYIEHPRTIILSTHLIQEVEKLFEEVVIIDRGRLVLHEEAESLRRRGAAVTGPADVVDTFTTGMTVLSERRLGGTQSSTVYGELGDERRRQAKALGLELEPVSIQDLFVHLTGEEVEAS